MSSLKIFVRVSEDANPELYRFLKNYEGSKAGFARRLMDGYVMQQGSGSLVSSVALVSETKKDEPGQMKVDTMLEGWD